MARLLLFVCVDCWEIYESKQIPMYRCTNRTSRISETLVWKYSKFNYSNDLLLVSDNNVWCIHCIGNINQRPLTHLNGYFTLYSISNSFSLLLSKELAMYNTERSKLYAKGVQYFFGVQKAKYNSYGPSCKVKWAKMIQSLK